ncbi:hypothetical protein GCM10025876_02590 [Demequina litorisediminis]|uniref:Alpha-glucosidase n=1 Tax=Demequina litorisediminis TaxID=1849022 RepID=A0ABQ6I8I6_9MICO|nr:hypothetical protein GCM10025876_02590 [Demequina litorisediminis]
MPLPWSAAEPAYGFNSTGETWLPQPAEWASLARDAQREDPTSTLNLYTEALRLRRELGLAEGAIEWIADAPAGVVAFRTSGIEVWSAVEPGVEVPLPDGEVVLASATVTDTIPADTTVWLRR